MRLTHSNWMTGMHRLFKGSANPVGAQPELMLGQIRRTMLKVVKESGADQGMVVLRRVTYAHGFQDLWYLRGDVLAAIASTKGEVEAREQITQISSMFEGYLPPGLVSRPSPLSE
jgi:hypothetical protein